MKLLVTFQALTAFTILAGIANGQASTVESTSVAAVVKTEASSPVTVAQVPEPTSTAEAVEAAVPAPEDLQFQAPFSLKDCVTLLELGIRSLPESNDDASAYTKDSLAQLLVSIERYIKHRDDLHASTMGYRWRQLEESVEVTTALMKPSEPPIKFSGTDIPVNVNAIALSVRGGDIYVHDIIIKDDNNESIPFRFPSQAVLLREHLPRRAVFHLMRPTDISEISLATSLANPGASPSPTVGISIGRSSDPEYGKMAIWHLWQALPQIREGEYVRARNNLVEARRYVLEYRELLRAERR